MLWLEISRRGQWACFESYMEFREEVDKVKKERGQKAAAQPPEDVSNFITEDL